VWGTVVRWRSWRPGEPVYLRYGLWSRRSTNHATGSQERGVSVYAAKVVDGIVEPENPDEISFLCTGRFAWPVTGKQIATGSDGEPVLQAVQCLNLPIRLSARPPKNQ
jgi:hypothetical protein